MSKQYIEQCVRCGGEVLQKDVTAILLGGGNTAQLRVTAGVCQLCGERYYTPEAIRQFEEIENKLKRQETAGFEVVGQAFEVMLSPST